MGYEPVRPADLYCTRFAPCCLSCFPRIGSLATGVYATDTRVIYTFPIPHGTRLLRALVLAGAIGVGAMSVAAFVWPALYDLASFIRLAVDFGDT